MLFGCSQAQRDRGEGLGVSARGDINQCLDPTFFEDFCQIVHLLQVVSVDILFSAESVADLLT